MYQFVNDLNSNQFFRFSKKWVLDMNWAMLPLRAKAVLPVILAFDNGKGHSWPSEGTICALSGLSRKTVRQGIKDLRGFAEFSYSWKMTKRGRQSKHFAFDLPGSGKKEVFFFHKDILSGGNWRLLKPVGKAVYIVLRTFSQWDSSEFYESDESENTNENFRESFSHRNWEYSEIGPGLISKYSGIERARVYGALSDLSKLFFIERCGERWKIFINPPQYFERKFLNEQLMKAFGYELKE